MATLTAVEVPTLVIRATWETYERILDENPHRPGLRIAFDGNYLEFMSPSTRHEKQNRRLQTLIDVLAEELAIDVESVGSLTLKRSDLERGFEPDSSFYVQSLPAVEEVEEVDLEIHPPPDLTIEVEVSRGAINRFAIFAELGIPEVWTVRESRVTFHILRERGYEVTGRSLAFPILSSADVSELLQDRGLKRSTAWTRETRRWIRARLGKS